MFCQLNFLSISLVCKCVIHFQNTVTKILAKIWELSKAKPPQHNVSNAHKNQLPHYFFNCGCFYEALKNVTTLYLTTLNWNCNVNLVVVHILSLWLDILSQVKLSGNCNYPKYSIQSNLQQMYFFKKCLKARILLPSIYIVV